MKKVFLLLLSLMLAAGLLAGCGSDAKSGSSGTAANAKVLVVYFSATGNTKSAAETIADTLDADIFEITPEEPYSDEDLDWNDENSRVVKERDSEKLQDQVKLKTTKVDNWDSYDTIFLGYPIWWGDSAWPINRFVQENDFSGKKVIPFCTSSSSGISESAENLRKMAGSGDWQKGKRFSSPPDESEVASWAGTAVKE
ncbi:MAG: flavodoxin [Anaerovoracaceae bacterium]|jgi:flavodoxin